MTSTPRLSVAVLVCLATACVPPPDGDEPTTADPIQTIQQAATTYPAIDFSTRPSYISNNVIALTFDDGPDTTNTPLVLNTLRDMGVKATFFINTNNFGGPVENSSALKALIQRIVNEGHQLANHSVHHWHLIDPMLTTADIDGEIVGVQTVVNRSDVLGASYPPITMFRDPFGEPHQTEVAGQPNYDKVAPIVGRYAVHMGWAIDTEDWACTGGTASQNQQCVLNNFTNAVRTVGNGDYGIVLMHSVQPQTAAALPSIINYCRNNGFVFKQGEDFVMARFGKSSHDVIYPVAPPPPPPCTHSPFGGTARAIPGTIQAEDYDNGGQGCAYNDTTTGNNGNAYRTTENVDLQATTDSGGGFNVGWVAAGEWLDYSVNVATAGNYKLELRVAATATGKTIDVLAGGTLIANDMPVPNTGAYQTFATINVPSVALAAGPQIIRVLFNNSSVNLNWIRFTAVTSTGPSYFYFEAENGSGANTAPMGVASDANASGGKYTWNSTTSSNSAVPSNGHITYTFNVTTAGTYKVWGRFLVGPSTSSDDSLWVRVDSSTWVQWNDLYPRLGNTSYRWDPEHNTPASNAVVTHSLATGTHTLEVAYRENGLKMDRFLVTNDLAFTP